MSFVRTVLVGLDSAHDAIDSVAIDTSSEREMAQRVLTVGHRSVAVVRADPPDLAKLRERSARYHSELEAGRAQVMGVSCGGGPELAASLRKAVERGASAVMAGEDSTAVEILEILADWGIAVPDRVSSLGLTGWV